MGGRAHRGDRRARLSGRRGALLALVTASTVSALGSRVSMVAVPWLVLITTGDPGSMGLVIGAQMIPYLLSGVFGTPVADRLGVRFSAVTADVVSAVTTATVAATPRIGLPTILAMSAISGLVRGSGDRTKHVMLRPAAEAAGFRMVRVTAVYQGLTNGATLVGAPLGGLLIYWFGAQGAIWADAGSYALAAGIVATLVRPQWINPDGAEPARERYLSALRGGARYLLRDRVLLGMLVMIFFSNMVNQAHSALLVPLWISQVLRSPAALGTVFGAFAAGAVLGNLLFTAVGPKLPRYLTFALALAIGGAPRILVLLSHDLGLVLGVTFGCGLAVAAANPILGVVLYERVPAELQTRVFGLTATVCYAGYPLGGLLGGAALHGFGLTATILAGGGIYLVATLLPLLRYQPASTPAPTEPEPVKQQ
jgi:MFS family permease